jgi:serine protease
MVEQLRANPDVEYAEPDYIRTRSGDPVTPSDELFPKQWGLPMVKAPNAWGGGYEGSGAVTVAIIDTGYVAHPEIADRVIDQWDFISDPANAGDGDGRDGDATDTGDSTDQSSALHGTHVAGIIGADTNTNGLGIAGVDWHCNLVIVRALGVSHGTGVDSDISDAIRWAAGLHVDGVPDNATPAQVINMSFGGKGASQTMQAAVDDAVAAGAVVVTAAGNTGEDAAGDSPAGLRGVITVGAVEPGGQLARYSNWGKAVSLLAPGGLLANDANGNPEGILSTIESKTAGYTYAYYAGTSQAAPYVSATVSLMKALAPTLTPLDVQKMLMASANPDARCPSRTNASEPGCGAGLLDVDAALALASDQVQCAPGCDQTSVCNGGQCVSVASLLPADFGATPPAGGCATTGRSPGPLTAAGLAVVAMALWLRRRRV